VSTFGNQNSEIGYATSQSMDVGTWTDHGSSGVASTKAKPYNAIDGNLVEDSGGNFYMAFGSFWQGLYISPVQVASDGALRKVGSEKQIAFQPAGDHGIEAAYVYKHDGAFYLFFSAGKCCGLDRNRPAPGTEYRILVCRSTGGASGPYVDKSGRRCTEGGGTVVLPSHEPYVYAPGGQGVYTDPQLGPVLYYHYGKSINLSVWYRGTIALSKCLY
jgi:arabinan endo-1,5-alpha-L-arabinosidase